MADSSVPITAGSGTNIDTRTVTGGDHRQVVVLGDGAGDNLLSTTTINSKTVPDFNLAGSASDVASVSATVSATGASSLTGTGNTTGSVVAAVSQSGNATISLTGGTYTQLTIVFEGCQDGTGTVWFPIDGTRSDGGGVETQPSFLAAGATPLARVWNIPCPGYTFVRVRVVTITKSADPTITITQGAFLFDPSPVVAPLDGQKWSFSATINNTFVAAAVTANVPVWELVNPTASGRIMRITRLFWQLTLATAGTSGGLLLVKRTLASTGGTAVTQTPTPHDSSAIATTATSKYYTAIPTVAGSSLGNVRSARVFAVASTLVANPNGLEWTFGNRPIQALVLRQGESLSFQGQAAFGTAPTLVGDVEWSEETA